MVKLTQREIRILKAFVEKLKFVRRELNKHDGVVRNVDFNDIIKKTVED